MRLIHQLVKPQRWPNEPQPEPVNGEPLNDYQRFVQLLEDFGLDYEVDDNDYAQGNESSYTRVLVPSYGEKTVHEWFFYRHIGGKGCDQSRKIGEFCSMQNWQMPEPWLDPDNVTE
jgi:hypothetical protein